MTNKNEYKNQDAGQESGGKDNAATIPTKAPNQTPKDATTEAAAAADSQGQIKDGLAEQFVQPQIAQIAQLEKSLLPPGPDGKVAAPMTEAEGEAFLRSQDQDAAQRAEAKTASDNAAEMQAKIASGEIEIPGATLTAPAAAPTPAAAVGGVPVPAPTPSGLNVAPTQAEFVAAKGGGSAQSISKKVRDMIAAGPVDTDEARLAAIVGDTEQLTELGMAHRFAAQHHHHARYCPDLEKWFMFNSKVWEQCEAAELIMDLEDILRSMAASCRGLLQGIAPEEINNNPLASKVLAMANYAVKCCNLVPISHILTLAQSMMAIRADEFDTHPHLIVCKNGTINLKTKTLMGESHVMDIVGAEPGAEPQTMWTGHFDPEHYITYCRPIDYNPDACHPKLAAFIRSAFGNNDDVIGFWTRWCGYCLTGDVSAEKLAIFEGKGGCGKSILIDMMQKVGGRQATICPFKVWTTGKYDSDAESASPLLANLEGARCITCSEVQEGKILHSARIKSFTGGDTIAARKLHQAPRYFKPIGKLSFFCNDLPKVDVLDSGFWRRAEVVHMPYVPSADDRDETLKATIENDREAQEYLLALFVNGAKDWYDRGLDAPPEVTNVTARYKEEQDPLKDFLDDHRVTDCRLMVTEQDTGTIRWTSFKDILVAFNSCRMDNAERPMSGTALGRLLAGCGFNAARRCKARGYTGLIVDMAQFPLVARA
jgi:P4 family phage/plasmid primase-like protien